MSGSPRSPSRAVGHQGTNASPNEHDNAGLDGGLEAYERDREDRPPFYLTMTEVKLLGISGVSRQSVFLTGTKIQMTAPPTNTLVIFPDRILPRCV